MKPASLQQNHSRPCGLCGLPLIIRTIRRIGENDEVEI